MGLFGGKKGLFGGILKSAAKLFGGLTGGLLGGLLGKKPKEEDQPVAPVVTPPPVMPLPDDDEIEKVRKRSIAAQLARRGRQSTILTDPVTGGSDTLG